MRFVDKVEKAQSLIKETLAKYERVALACSFGKDSMVVLHLALRVKRDIKVFSVMTPFKPAATFRYKKQMEKKYKLNIVTYMVNKGVAHANNLEIWRVDPDWCCQFYKVGATRQAIKALQLDAWITGLRRTEGRTRANYDFVENRGGLIKINPILDFTELDVWRYLAINNIPPNPLYKEGYRSLGCAPCTRKEGDETEEERTGRWAGTKKHKGECGIHTQNLR